MSNNPLRDRFSEIYATDEWGKGSGEGSLPVHTKGYATLIERFIRQHNVQSVVDVGCGDWQFSRFINWNHCRYTGLDIVPGLVETNTSQFACENIQFATYDGNFSHLPKAELLIIKDVLQHLSQQKIIDFLAILDDYPYALITNCINPHGITENRDIPDGGFRYLDLTLSPFELSATEVYRFSNHRSLMQRLYTKPRWMKKVLVHYGK